MTFLQELKKQRWDDHRFYHHNRINQFLHLLSAMCFVVSYVLVFYYPAAAALVGWLLSMILRQSGHFFFEPLTYDKVNDVSHEYKEEVKVGYNLQRKVVLLSIWALVPLVLYFEPSLFGLFEAHTNGYEFINNIAITWLFIGIGAVLFRTLHLFKLMGVQSGLVWFTKILTDPFHDIKIYHKSPYHLLKGEMYDDMTDWYEEVPASN
ncbi:hypothetical protein KO505_11185 [Psychrosphaera sp. F3M07]|jgi:hypothetical protein|uniref:hypothetical protein n=1 Tax=Psychrosphaera sp. F3M07 TaxID=2841560 RepID=UPI001C086A7E|nr:hypothetical protein [Psychrosphaera sp. F3M07]MBU2918520.1 hypothetical protein [Psychrosphaera sp. F3M07]